MVPMDSRSFGGQEAETDTLLGHMDLRLRVRHDYLDQGASRALNGWPEAEATWVHKSGVKWGLRCGWARSSIQSLGASNNRSTRLARRL